MDITFRQPMQLSGAVTYIQAPEIGKRLYSPRFAQGVYRLLYRFPPRGVIAVAGCRGVFRDSLFLGLRILFDIADCLLYF